MYIMVTSYVCYSAVHRCFFTLDRTHIASFSDDKSICLWDIPSENKVTSFSEHSVSRFLCYEHSVSRILLQHLDCCLSTMSFHFPAYVMTHCAVVSHKT
jgi:WD40 repeat protein